MCGLADIIRPQACASDASKYPLSDLHEDAQDLLRQVNNVQKPVVEVDPGFVSSFFIYPKGQASAYVTPP